MIAPRTCVALPVPAFVLLLLLAACGHAQPAPKPLEPAAGPWHMDLDLDSTTGTLALPFQFDMLHDNGSWSMVVHNQDEAIKVDSIVVKGDSIRIRMPFFDSEFRGRITADSAFSGVWINHYKGPGYAIPFTATAGAAPRFATRTSTRPTNITGDWEVHFLEGDTNEPAIGIFKSEGGLVKGSFATETGDLRYLEGTATEDSLFLSSFNGSQAYLFRAAIRHDSLIGEFRSGHRYVQAWYGVRNPGFKLADDERATALDPAHSFFFSFPDVNGRTHSSNDPEYAGKVMVVEVMGTWCPNCMDEANMLNGFNRKYADAGLRIVGLGFERYPDKDMAIAALDRFQKGLGISYDILYAGTAQSDSVKAKLPFIQKLKGYPTTFLIARDGSVRHIYTGIYGPGTGERYFLFRDRMENAIVQLLKEPVPEH